MDMSSMASMTMSMASSTATAAASTSSAASMGDMDMGGGCKINMLWNWYTIDSCFLASSWHNRSKGAFAASCIGVALLAVSIEFFRRVGKEYDAAILRKFQRSVSARTADVKPPHASESCHSEPQYVIFRATPLQQIIRSVIHAVTFGIAYIVMLLAMYYNGYIIISIFIGAGIGKFVCDWMVQKVPVGGMLANSTSRTVDETTAIETRHGVLSHAIIAS
ncbi:hypothetical protein H2200_012947 [Cladophialophora chaetospira]|uniref:Copper transport protein n=1 Tax=Cladophialophora chaetospira TaxID=386627 RepID=A0AA39CBN0_9EURO|nr:hypothetical protein H2200_012947 [Cladophialophora chaetospira]